MAHRDAGRSRFRPGASAARILAALVTFSSAAAGAFPARRLAPAAPPTAIEASPAGGLARSDRPERSDGVERPSFAAFFEGQVAVPHPLPPNALAAARRYRYVFVAGFLNEAFRPGYFNENRDALLDAGVGAGAIHVVFPRSADAVAETAGRLRQEIPALAAAGHQKLILIGHSKGAAELLAFALGDPAFVRARVEAIFLVQGAIGGSGVADYITDAGHPLDDEMPAAARVAFAVAARAGKLLDGQLDRGFQSLTHRQAAALWARLVPGQSPSEAISAGLKDRAQARAKAPAGAPAERIFYVRSHRKPAGVSKILSLTATYLSAYYGDNDGLVEVEDQWIPGLGRVLATLEADHMALTVARPVSGDGPAVRRAFTDALLMQLAGALAPAGAAAPAPAR
jgi:hypothetical protein